MVPTRPDDYWECARILCQDTNNRNTFLEWILLGPDRNVCLHLLIPTQFGILMNSVRTKRILDMIKQHPGKVSVLIKQHECINQCVKCGVALEEDGNRPRQVVLRIASGQALHDEWNYDFLLCFFCFDCQTVKTCALLKTSETMVSSLNACIARYGFAEGFAPIAIRDNLMYSYLDRFLLLNYHMMSILEECMYISKYCYHCGKQVKRLKVCEDCGVVYFCKRGDCQQKATNNHHQHHLCPALREKHIFHVEDAFYVTTTGEEVLPCKSYVKI